MYVGRNDVWLRSTPCLGDVFLHSFHIFQKTLLLFWATIFGLDSLSPIPAVGPSEKIGDM